METPVPRPRDPQLDRLFSILTGADVVIGAEEWRPLIDLATAHNVHSLLAQRVLSRGGAPASPPPLVHAPLQRRRDAAGSAGEDAGAPLPEAIAAELRYTQLETVRRNTQRLRDFSEIVTAMQAKDIPVIALKGMHLVPLVHRNLGARRMVDLDLLVPPQRLADAIDALRAIGYTSPPFRLVPDDPVPYFSYTVPPFQRKDSSDVDLHWHIHNLRSGASINVPEFWEHSVPARIGTVDVRVLANEDLLLHVAEHATYAHRCEISVRACFDIAEIVNRIPLDWNAVIDRAQRWKIAPGTYLILRLARELTGANVPEEVLAALKPEPFDERLLHIAFRGRGHLRASRRLRSARGLRQKLRTAKELFFIDRYELADLYQVNRTSPLVYGLYVVRAFRMLRRWRDVSSELRTDGHEAAESALVDSFLGGALR